MKDYMKLVVTKLGFEIDNNPKVSHYPGGCYVDLGLGNDILDKLQIVPGKGGAVLTLRNMNIKVSTKDEICVIVDDIKTLIANEAEKQSIGKQLLDVFLTKLKIGGHISWHDSNECSIDIGLPAGQDLLISTNSKQLSITLIDHAPWILSAADIEIDGDGTNGISRVAAVIRKEKDRRVNEDLCIFLEVLINKLEILQTDSHVIIQDYNDDIDLHTICIRALDGTKLGTVNFEYKSTSQCVVYNNRFSSPLPNEKSFNATTPGDVNDIARYITTLYTNLSTYQVPISPNPTPASINIFVQQLQHKLGNANITFTNNDIIIEHKNSGGLNWRIKCRYAEVALTGPELIFGGTNLSHVIDGNINKIADILTTLHKRDLMIFEDNSSY